MKGAEQCVHDLWWIRVVLARPTAIDPKDIERAVKSCMQDPTGPYAREIKQTAERREMDLWYKLEAEDAPYCTRCGTRMIEGEPKTYGCPNCGAEIGV